MFDIFTEKSKYGNLFESIIVFRWAFSMLPLNLFLWMVWLSRVWPLLVLFLFLLVVLVFSILIILVQFFFHLPILFLLLNHVSLYFCDFILFLWLLLLFFYASLEILLFGTGSLAVEALLLYFYQLSLWSFRFLILRANTTILSIIMPSLSIVDLKNVISDLLRCL